MDPVLAGGFVAALGLAMALSVYLQLRRRPGRADVGRSFWLMLVGMSLVIGACVWAFASGRPALAIGLLISVFVLPELVLMPLRIRRSRTAARAARDARRQS